MFIRENPVRLANKIADAVRGIQATPGTVTTARQRLRKRRDARHEPEDRKGSEYVVENVVRPRLARFLSREYKFPSKNLPFCLASSHYHSATDECYEVWWRVFQARHPQADTFDEDRHLRRADLFVGTSEGQVVSIELKHLRAGHSLSIDACVAQVKQYLEPGDGGRGHDATVLFVYQERPARSKPHEVEAQLIAALPRNAVAVVIEGPPVLPKTRKGGSPSGKTPIRRLRR